MLASTLELPCGASLPNRVAKAATSEALADRRTGAPTSRLSNLYARWGRGGAGLLITGNVVVAREGRTEPGNVIIVDDRDRDALAHWAAAAKSNGAKVWMQINHSGRQAARRITSQPVAPSVVPMKGFGGLFGVPRELTDAEILELVERFATAARVAKAAGFDGVEIHAAHGYLVSQFLSPYTNTRTDAWGGDPERRMRFLVEIVRAIRREVGPAFPIGVKLNSADFQRGGFTEEESMGVVQQLEREGIDLLEISGGSYEKSAMMGSEAGARESTRRREAYFLDYAQKVRRLTKLPLLLTGGMRSAATMKQVIADGHVDMVGLARPLAVEPDLPARLLSDDDAEAVLSDPRLGVKLFDDMLQVVWYQAQMHRMGAGLEPDRALGRVRALVVGFFASYAFNPLAALLPAKRREPAAALESA
jgi:2,4-dienoyl-CoA reductase-like NADH-dependent reductase (Old Yellow Enzyme family)